MVPFSGLKVYLWDLNRDRDLVREGPVSRETCDDETGTGTWNRGAWGTFPRFRVHNVPRLNCHNMA